MLLVRPRDNGGKGFILLTTRAVKTHETESCKCYNFLTIFRDFFKC